MAIWEYKVISSGKGGFATPALLESFLNQLGAEEWEIIEFRTPVDNPLAFHGLARRLTQRDWTLEAAAAAAARVEADKVRAEFAAKFQAATSSAGAGAASSAQAQAEAEAEGGGEFRRPRDTEHDQDPYALDDSAEDDADDWPEEDQLPSFFEAIRPHMRRNQKGPGYSVGVDYLVKKFDMIEDDVLAALGECGFAIPEDEDDKPVYLEYDGDLYWLNVNRRGELWINTREKPRPVFKTVKATPVAPEAAQEKPEKTEASGDRRQQRRQQEGAEGAKEQRSSEPVAGPSGVQGPAVVAQPSEVRSPEPVSSGESLPMGAALLAKLRPMMRRSRGGWSGTVSYLSRALKCSDSELVAALASVGLVPPSSSGEKAPVVELDEFCYWLNRDGRGGIWINAREAKRMRPENKPAEEAKPLDKQEAPAVSISVRPVNPEDGQPSPEIQAVAVAAALSAVEPATGQPAPSALSDAPKPESVPTAEEPSGLLAQARPLLKEGRTGSFSLEIGALASSLGQNPEDLLSSLVGAGLKVPEKPREKPVFVESAGEIYWLNLNAKGKLWLNVKASKFASASQPAAEAADMAAFAEDQGKEEGEKKRKRPARTKKKAE